MSGRAGAYTAALLLELLVASAGAATMDLGKWGANDWSVTVDGVMGGRSSGKLSASDDGLVFSGDINLNGGGFSSIRRSLGRSVDLSAYAGIWCNHAHIQTCMLNTRACMTV